MAKTSLAEIGNTERRSVSGYVEPIVDQAALPTPLTWHVLVQPMDISPYKGSIELPKEIIKKAEFLRTVCRVCKIGPMAFKDPAKYGENPEVPFKVGDWVLTDIYAGQRHFINDQEFKMVTEDDIRALVPDPGAFKFYI